MCTSFVHRKGGILIGMNFDNNGMPYSLSATPEAFTVLVDGGWGRRPSFGVTARGIFANNLFVDAPPDGKGAYKRASATRIHTQLLAERVLGGAVAGAGLPDLLNRMEIVNGPGQSCHNLLVDETGTVFVVEPGRGWLQSPAGESPFFVMTNCPLVDCGPEEPRGDGEDRYRKASERLGEFDILTVEDAFEVLRQTAQAGGDWKTVFSMVYSGAENAVYYCIDRQFGAVVRHTFAEQI